MNESTVEARLHCRKHREDGAARCWTVARQCLVGLALTVACLPALAQATYRIQPIKVFPGGCTNQGGPYVDGLNGADQVTGLACNANGDLHAFLWKNDGTPTVDLGPPELGSYSYPSGINASGQVVVDGQDSTGKFVFISSGDGAPIKRIYDSFGGSDVSSRAINDLGHVTGVADNGVGYDSRAFLWKNDGSPVLDLGTLGGYSSFGIDINASGEITGQADLPGSNASHAFVWKNNRTPMLDLGTLGGNNSDGLYINASGQVAGFSDVTAANAPSHAFFWANDGTPMRDLGTLGGPYSEVFALNNAGQVVGDSDTATVKHGFHNYHAFVWLNDGTPMKDLGTFGGCCSQAYDINASGEVIGWANLPGTATVPFLWRNDGTKIQQLNKLIDPTDPLKPFVTIYGADYINDRGDIAAEGADSRTGLVGVYLLKSTGTTTSALTLSPRSLAFGAIPVNSSSASQSVTVTNTSPNVVAIAGIALRGTSPKQFAFTDDCGKSLTAHATCTLKVQFKPSVTGAKTAFLDVNGGRDGRSVKLTGTGT